MKRTNWANEMPSLIIQINVRLTESGADYRIKPGANAEGDLFIRYIRPIGHPHRNDPEYPDGSFRTSSVVGTTNKELCLYLRGYLQLILDQVR